MPEDFLCAAQLEDAVASRNGPAPLVEVLNVRRVDEAGTAVLNFVVDSPLIGDCSETHVLPLRGWVLGVKEGVRELIVHERGCDVRRIPINTERPDVLAAFPEACAQVCGFNTYLSYLGADRDITYTLLAGMADGTEIVIAHIDVRVGPLGTQRDAGQKDHGMQPLMLTTLGRSGSTLIMGILSRHPEIVAYRPFEYEARVGRYWVDVFASLAQPGSYLQSIVPTNIAKPEWWLGHGEVSPGTHLPDESVMAYLAGEAIDGLADGCRERIENFYGHMGREMGKQSARYFAEKCSPDRNGALMRSLYPQRREIILVRDLRDMICSILAINRKRGYTGFGREKVGSDEEYIRHLRASAEQLLETATGDGTALTACLLRYEDFVRDPQGKLREVLAFLGIDESQEVLDAMLRPAPSEVVERHCTSVDADASVGRWRGEFTEPMRAAFREHLEDISLKLGYEATEEAEIGVQSDGEMGSGI